MATLRQDVWLGENPRLSALRLGPFRDAAVRVLLHPHRAAIAPNPRLAEFAERLAERVEVLLLHPRPVEDASTAIAAWRDDFTRVIECLDQTWRDRLPLVVCGAGLGGALALALAAHPAVRAAAALAPYVPAEMTWPETTGSGTTFDPVALEKPILLVAPRDEPRLDQPRLQAAVARWAKATWVGPAGTAAAALAPVWALTLAEWALAATRE
jgi:hypothetical protein